MSALASGGSRTSAWSSSDRAKDRKASGLATGTARTIEPSGRTSSTSVPAWPPAHAAWLASTHNRAT